MRIVNQMTTALPAARCARCCRPSGSCELQELVLRVPAAPHVVQHAVALCRATPARRSRARPSFVKKYVSWGAGPRASQYLVLAAKARAILRRALRGVDRGRARAGARRCCVHRVLPNFHAEADGLDARAAGRAAASTSITPA